MSSKWSSGVEEVKRIAQLLIPDASASFHARIYISFSRFHFISLSSCLAPPDLSILSTSVKRIDIKTLAQALRSNSLCAMPKPVYVSIIYNTCRLRICECAQAAIHSQRLIKSVWMGTAT